MKKVLLTAAALVSFGVASSAIAGGLDQSATQQNIRSGLYAGIAGGWGEVTTPSSMLTNEATVNSSAINMQRTLGRVAARANAGYLFNITNNFLVGPELGYNYLPNTKYTYSSFNFVNTGKLTDYSLDLLGVGKFYVTNAFNVFGKAGVAYVRQKAKFTTTNVSTAMTQSTALTEDKFLPTVGAGVGYNLSPCVEATATYMHAFGKSRSSLQQGVIVNNVPTQTFGDAITSYNTVLVGLNYGF